MRSISPPTLFLDFDGVICNSLEECYRSSWMVVSGDSEPPDAAAYRALFAACRPFIRSGEDYVVAHEWAQRQEVPSSQDEFDRSLAAKGPEDLADLKVRLYRVRDALLAHRRSEWLSWNPLYKGMAQALEGQRENEAVWILSTKKASFIGEILAYHGISWPEKRTVYTGNRRKLDLIAEILPEGTATLIDDQIDHLDFSHPTCRCLLALWGYASPAAMKTAPATVSLDDALTLISSFPRPRRDE